MNSTPGTNPVDHGYLYRAVPVLIWTRAIIASALLVAWAWQIAAPGSWRFLTLAQEDDLNRVMIGISLGYFFARSRNAS